MVNWPYEKCTAACRLPGEQLSEEETEPFFFLDKERERGAWEEMTGKQLKTTETMTKPQAQSANKWQETNRAD